MTSMTRAPRSTKHREVTIVPSTRTWERPITDLNYIARHGTPRELTFRFHADHSTRPASSDGIRWTEFLIEDQLTRLHDEWGASLDVFGLMIDKAIVNEIDALYDLADEAAQAEALHPRSDATYDAIDRYCDQLHRLAVMARGGAR